MFLESILFLQKLKKFQKQCCPILVTQSQVIQVACYSRKLACWFWWLIHEWRVQSRGVHRDFRSSAHDSLAGRPSSCENHLENFSQFCLWVFWQLDLATCWQLTLVMKNVCLAKIGSVFKPFQFSLKLFYDYSLSLSTESHLYTPCHSTNSIVALVHLQIFKKKGMSSYSLTSYLLFWASFSWVFVLMFWYFFFVVMGLFWCFWDYSCLDY